MTLAPRGCDRSRGTRIVPHSAAGTGAHPGVGARLDASPLSATAAVAARAPATGVSTDATVSDSASAGPATHLDPVLGAPASGTRTVGRAPPARLVVVAMRPPRGGGPLGAASWDHLTAGDSGCSDGPAGPGRTLPAGGCAADPPHRVGQHHRGDGRSDRHVQGPRAVQPGVPGAALVRSVRDDGSQHVDARPRSERVRPRRAPPPARRRRRRGRPARVGTATSVMPWSFSAWARARPSPMPSAAPAAAPMREMTTDSHRTMARTWPRVMPTARSSPSSRVRSYTDSARVLTMPSSAMTTASRSMTETKVRSWSTMPGHLRSNCRGRAPSRPGGRPAPWRSGPGPPPGRRRRPRSDQRRGVEPVARRRPRARRG